VNHVKRCNFARVRHLVVSGSQFRYYDFQVAISHDNNFAFTALVSLDFGERQLNGIEMASRADPSAR
jgi:hypothetical protein